MKKKWIWISLVVIALLGAGYYFRTNIMGLMGGQGAGAVGAAQAQGRGGDGADSANQAPTTITIRPATDSTQVSAAGNIEVADQYTAELQADGAILDVLIEIGDEVSAGDVLIVLDTASLERAVQRAELALDASQNELDRLLEPASAADIASARANLASAQENLVDVQAGPGAAEMAAAEAALIAAHERHQELLDGPSEAELTQLGVELHKATITLQNAQEAYDRISYRGDIGSSSQAIDLQNATIDYDAAKAAYEIATEPASSADLQDAIKTIRDAESQLETLRGQPSAADVAAAEAQVTSAEAELATLLDGPSESDLREAELNLEQARLDLEEAEAELAQGRLRAPISGTILAITAEDGDEGSSSRPMVILADLTDLEITVNVAEVDIPRVKEGQPAQITIDALPGQIFSGLVSRIAPTSDSESGVVNYGVTIQLDDLNLDSVRPGMTAVATISDVTTDPGWLVPTNALQEFEGQTTVIVVRDGQRTRVEVTPGTPQGEWTVVHSAGLRAGDEVVGQVSSFLDEEDGGGFRGPFGGGPPRN